MLVSRRDFIHAGCAAGVISLTPHFLDKAEAGLHHGASTVQSLVLTDIPANKLHQRSAALTTSPVPLSGTFSGGALSGVQAQVLKVSDNSIVKDWTDVSATIGGGTWSGVMPAVPQGGTYYAKVRASNAPAVGATGANGWYVGLLFICYGQSNMGTFGGTQSAPIPTPSANLVSYDTTHGWAALGSGDLVGNGIIAFLNDMIAAAGVPCGAVTGAIAGTDIAFLADARSQAAGGGVGGGGFWRYQQIMASGGIIDGEMVLWMQGEGSVNRDQISYLSYLSILHGEFGTQFGRTKSQLPFVLFGLTTYGATDFPPNTDAEWSTVRTTHFHAAQQQTNMHFSHSNMDGVRQPADPYHLDGTSQERGGHRASRTVKSILGLGGVDAHFEISGGAVVDATHTTITLALTGGATDISPSTGGTGFEVTGNNGATWISATAARASATSLTLTHASIATSSVRKVRYQYGMLPDVSSPIKDNSSLTLPLTYTADIISPTPLSAVPTPISVGSFLTDLDTATQTASFPIRPNPTQLVIIVIGAKAGSGSNYPGLATVTVTPNVGTPITATAVANSNDPTANGSAIFQALLLSDADAATQIDVKWVVSNNPFGHNTITVFTVPSASLSSTTATDHQIASAASANAASVNVNVSAGGFIISAGTSSGGSAIGTSSGTETFATIIPDFQLVANGQPTVGAAAGCAANASSTATVTFTGAASTVNIVAASWR